FCNGEKEQPWEKKKETKKLLLHHLRDLRRNTTEKVKSLASPPCLRLTPDPRQPSSTFYAHGGIKSNSLSFSSSASGFVSLPLAVEK
ncbi:hypothetical protein IGI04_027487, partial [Brassica rapa subsp. trilocularis]